MLINPLRKKSVPVPISHSDAQLLDVGLGSLLALPRAPVLGWLRYSNIANVLI